MKPKDFLRFVFWTIGCLILINVVGTFVWNRLERTIATKEGVEFILNDLGLRENLSADQLSGLSEPILAILGNSVVAGFAYDLEDTFAKRTADILAQNRNKPFYGLNFGFDGYEIYREFDAFIQKSSNLPVQHVVWIPGISDRVERAFVEEKVREIERQKAIHTTKKLKIQEQLLTGFYKRIAQKIYVDRSSRQLKFISSEHNRYYLSGMIEPIDGRVRQDISQAIRDFRAYLKARGIELYVVFVPPFAYRREKNWDQAIFFQIVASVLDEEKIPYLQLLDYFYEHRNQDFYLDYVHLNRAGHRVVAEKIGEFLGPLILNDKVRPSHKSMQ